MSSANNSEGRNQYGTKPKADDATLSEALLKYHRERIVSNKKISKRLKAEYGIDISDSTVKRRRKELGLMGCKVAEPAMSPSDVKGLVLDELAKDPAMKTGPRTMVHRVAYSTGVHIKRNTVSQIMHDYFPEGFKQREPTAKKIRRTNIDPEGINWRWSADGHDKLNKIGFSIWAVVDQASSRWLGGWVMPNNRYGDAVAICFLNLVIEYGGIPLTLCTDCGSETNLLSGIMSHLREKFHPNLTNEAPPAHVQLKSVHNVSIERAWRNLRTDFGDAAVVRFQEGVEKGIYNEHNPDHYELSRWVWARAMRNEMGDFMQRRNAIPMRLDKGKLGPSGMSRNEAYVLPEEWGGVDCLLPVDVAYVQRKLGDMEGHDLLEFSTPEYSERAEAVFAEITVSKLDIHTAWPVFQAMYSRMYVGPSN